MNAVMLFIVLTLPGKEPFTQQMPETSIWQCVADVGEFLSKVDRSPTVGQFQASCVVQVKPSIDN